MTDRPRLDRRAVAERLDRLESALARLEGTPGPTAESALDAVSTLTEVYGEALARVVDHASGPLAEMLRGDELLRHLLTLHDLHPDPVERRIERALDDVRPYLRSRGRDVELGGIDGGVARVRLSGGCGRCGSAEQEELTVREAVLAAAPELSDVRPAPPAATLIPVEALLRRPTAAGGAP